MHIQMNTSFQGVWFDQKPMERLRFRNKSLDLTIPLAENKRAETWTGTNISLQDVHLHSGASPKAFKTHPNVPPGRRRRGI